MADFSQRKPKTKINVYIICHIRAALSSLGGLLRKPFSSFMVVAVIGIALALPASLYMILQNAQSLGQHWNNNSTQISLYLNPDLSQNRTQDILNQLHTNPQISDVRYISPDEGLKEFGQTLDLKKLVAVLHRNPLPGVIVIQPILSLRTPTAIAQLMGFLKQLPEVDFVRLDMQWLQRLQNIISFARHVVLALAFLLGIGVLLIIGNTIWLATQNEQKEISILKMVGATNAFIRRPFLYTGIWYGLSGGIISWILVSLALWWLQGPVEKLAISYNSSFYLRDFSLNSGIYLLLFSVLLGIFGSWSAVHRNLRKYL